MKSKLKLLLATLLLAFSLSSCSAKAKKIDLFLYDATDIFISDLSSNIVSSLTEGYEIKIYDAKKSQVIQNKQIIDELKNDTPDVLVVNAVDRLSSSSIIQKANKYQIPVIFFNREPVYNDIKPYGNSYYVGTNPIQEGKNQALMAHKLMKDPKSISKEIDKNGDNKLQCIFLQGESGHQDTEKRTWACIDQLQQLGYEIEILAMEKANWNRDQGYVAMSNLYPKYKNIEFVFSNNDEMALGAIDYLMDNKYLHYANGRLNTPFPFVGVNGTKDGLIAIKDGLLYGTTINDSLKQADAIVSLIKLLQNEITIEEFNEKFQFDSNNEKYIYLSGKMVYQDMNL